ncbi:MAG: oxygenase MpaB family protein [Ferruginibacter sp.]
MQYFTNPGSVVRKIWGKADTILFIFAGASAEFALNKAVDWLYFTGKLPADPIGRLFSTVVYAKQIVFSEMNAANAAIDKITSIHSAVEKSRGAVIPDWAYRDVLYMLIHYSIASFELLERKLTEAERQEVFDVFYRVATRMHLKDLPQSYSEWLISREAHMEQNLQKGALTEDLFLQYRKHLGAMRYVVLIESQKLVVPDRVAELLSFNRVAPLRYFVPVYKMSRTIKADRLIKRLLLSPDYKKQIDALDEK